jgi:hypothetical protein
LRLDGRRYSPTLLEQIVALAGQLKSFEQAARALRITGRLQISGRHVNRLAAEVGADLARLRDAQAVARRRRQLQPRVKNTPALAVVEVDGGRLGTRQPGHGSGVFQAQNREDKVACLLSMQSQTYTDDPQPEPPASFRDAPRVVRLVRRMQSLTTSTDTPPAEESSAEGPLAEGPLAEEPTAEEPTAEGPTAEGPTAEGPTAEEPTAEEPTTEEPTAEGPTAEEPAAEGPTVEGSTVEGSTAEGPTVEGPTAEGPTAEEPAAEESTAEGPTAEGPTAEEPTTEEPTTEGPTTEEPTTEEPTTEGPTAEEPAAEGPTVEGSTAEGPTAEGPTVVGTDRVGAPKGLVRTCVATLQNSRKFGPMVAGEAQARGFFAALLQAFVGDGQHYNWSIQRAYFPHFVAIVDFLHVLCYLFRGAWALGGSEAERFGRYDGWMRACWQGRVDEVLVDLAGWQERLGRPPPGKTEEAAGVAEARELLAEVVCYLSNNRERMDYPRYRRQGLPVTSSLVESLVGEFNSRVKGRDKYWNAPEGAEAILQVRAAVLSADDRLARYFTQRPGNPYRRRPEAKDPAGRGQQTGARRGAARTSTRKI